MRLALVLIWSLGTALLAPLAAQGRSASRRAGDSSTAERTARQAQADFERARRYLSPDDIYPAHSCDVVVGRFCYWNDEQEPDPAPEPKSVGRARDKLLTVLDGTANTLAGDTWVLGQRVRYLVEAGDSALALEAARACRGVPWWCEALSGYAHQATGDFLEADSAFTAALNDMPTAERCAWNDVSPLMDDPSRDRFEKLNCAARDTVAARFWWLAQPLLSAPYNDFRTELYARRTLAILLEHSALPYEVRWGPDLDELTIRFGWPRAWTREPEAPAALTSPVRRMRGHDPKHGLDFTPNAHALAAPMSARADDWTPTAPVPRSHYAPGYATAFAPLPYQVARFRRGDSTLVIVACDPAALVDTSLNATTDAAHERVEGALVLGRDPATPPHVDRLAGATSDRAMVFSSETPTQDTLLASAELVAPWDHRLARARFALAPPAREPASQLAVSDILLFSPSDTLPDNVAVAAAAALPDARVHGRKQLGIYFEAYGVDSSAAADPSGIAITVEGQPESWLHRLAESLHLTRRSRRLAAIWHETLSGPTTSRSLILDVRDLRPGHYHLALEITPPNRPQVTATRELDIAEY